MKKKLKIFGLVALILAPVIAYAASETRLGYDKVTIGNSTAVNKEQRFNINLGAANPGLRGNTATSKIEFSHDGSVWKAIGSGGGAGGGGVVLNENFGFEDGATGWTASGGTFAITSVAANVGFGVNAASWTPSALNQTLSYSALTLPAGLYGKVCAISWYYKGADANYVFEVTDGTNTLATSSATSTQSTYSGKQVLYFTCPSSGSVIPRVRATSASPAQIFVDDFKIGQDTFFSGEPKKAHATAYHDTDCTWGRTNTAYGDVTADATCTFATRSNNGFATLSTSGSVLPIINFTPLESGTVEVCAISPVYVTTSGAAGAARIINESSIELVKTSEFGTGTNFAAPFHLCATDTVVQGVPKSFKIQTASTSGSVFLGSTSASSTESGIEWKVKYLTHAQTAEAITIDKTGWRIDANIGGANPSLPGAVVSTYTEITDGGLDMVLASGSATAEIPCSSTNPSTGLTCSAGLEGLGVVFTPPTAGAYEACAYFTHEGNGGSSASIETNFQFIETPNNAQTFTALGEVRTTSGIDLGSGTAGGGLKQSHTNCALFNFSDTSKRTLRLMYEQRTFNTIFTNRILADREALQGQRDIKISVRRKVEFADVIRLDTNSLFANPSRVEVQLGNGSGGTRTAIRRWANVIENVGTDITYTDSASNGAEFLINVSGNYAITWNARFTAATDVCLTKNQVADFATACNSIASPATYIISSAVTPGSGGGTVVSKTYYFTAGTVIRAHASATDDVTNFHNRFSIVRVR